MRGKKTYSCLLWGMISLIILSINVFHVKGFEHIEGNTTVRNAFEIPYLPFKLSVNIEDRNDVRWFKVELSQPGALRAITELYSGLVYDIYAEEELQKENPRPVVTNNVSITYDYCNYWKLEAGTYYIKLYPINSTDWKDKEINIEWDLFEDDEYEPNDTYQQATLVQLGEPMPVRITGYNDIEWFKIKVDKSKGLKIKSDGYFGLGYYIYSEDELQKESPTPLKVCRYYNYNSDYNCSLNSSNQYWKLEAGTYYIKVDTSGYDGDWEGKDIQLTFDTFEDDGYEPNDRYQQATPVQLGEPMTIRFSGDNDVDWFKIKVDKRISLKLKVDGNYASFYEIYTEEELQKIDPQPLMNYRNNPLDQAYKYWKLEAGTYYIKIFPTNSKWYKDLWKEKDIKITFDTALDDGYEPNDSYQQAASVQFDEPMTIKLSGFNDVDWFKVNLDYKAALKLKADNTVSYEIYSEEELQKRNPTSLGADRLESSYQYYDLEAGTYYIRFKYYYTSTIGEEVRITFGLFENDQYEPNDTYQQATSINLGEPMKIRFIGVTDIDWFKLKLEKPTAWNIKTDKNYSLAYSIYTEEEMKKSDPQPFINSGLDSSEDYMKLEAGTYYIKINQTTSSYYLGDKDIMLMSNFTLDDASEYNDTIELATALLLNEEKTININAPNDVDWFKFRVLPLFW